MDQKVGQFWDRYVTKKASRFYEKSQISFEDKAKSLKIFYHLLGGDKAKELHITDKRFLKTSRTLLEKFSGKGKSFFLVWQDDKALYFPATLSFFEDKKLNDMHYYWLCAMLAQVNINSQNIINENKKMANFLINK